MQEMPAQNFPAIDPQTGAAPRLVTPKRRMQKVPAENTSEQAIPSTAAPTALGQEKTPASQDPRAAAAQHQSGLTEAQARGLLQQRGYNSVNTLQPQPNSIWVWQADALKNGRPVRLGIDYRGNVLELGATATRCTLPGRSPTTGGFGAAARLSGPSGGCGFDGGRRSIADLSLSNSLRRCAIRPTRVGRRNAWFAWFCSARGSSVKGKFAIGVRLGWQRPARWRRITARWRRIVQGPRKLLR